VVLDRVHGDDQLVGNLWVTASRDQQMEHALFLGRKWFHDEIMWAGEI
jgi:hypothetical protein